MSYEEEIAFGVQQMLDADLQFPQEVHYSKKPVRTNADHIRSMTDTELKKFIVINIDEDRMCEKFCAKTKGECKGFCLSGVEDWLKQPYKEDTNG